MIASFELQKYVGHKNITKEKAHSWSPSLLFSQDLHGHSVLTTLSSEAVFHHQLLSRGQCHPNSRFCLSKPVSYSRMISSQYLLCLVWDSEDELPSLQDRVPSECFGPIPDQILCSVSISASTPRRCFSMPFFCLDNTQYSWMLGNPWES